MPINPVHIALMHNGKVLVVAGSGNVAAETNFRAAVWDPQADTIVTQIAQLGHVLQRDGVVAGRPRVHQRRQPAVRPVSWPAANAAFDPGTGVFTDLQNMAHGRWYPTMTMLGDGRVMTFSGLNETGGTNTAVEIYTVGSGWSPEYPAGWTPPLYPAHAPAAERQRPLCGLGHRLEDLQPGDQDVVRCRRDHELLRHADLRHLGPAAVEPRPTATRPAS